MKEFSVVFIAIVLIVVVLFIATQNFFNNSTKSEVSILW